MSRPRILLAGLLLLPATALLGLAAGASALTLPQLWAALIGDLPLDQAWISAVVLEVRLPRVLLAIAIGASLAETGVVLQALFRNPLAEQSLLGISGGAALSAAAALVLVPIFGLQLHFLGALALPAVATLGALAAAMLAIRLARRGDFTDIATLLLVGVSINALAGAGIALLQTLASDAALRDLTVWFYGSLGRAGWSELAIGLPLLLGIALWLPSEARALDAMLLGEADAKHLGVRIEPLKRRLLLLVAIAAATAVALAGMIGFIGLIVPHLLRRVIGPGHRNLLPAAGLFGASLLVLADTAARTLLAPLEIPVGALTALFGVPLFLMLLRRRGAAA